MRPDIGAYNFSLAYTPNMDKLANGGLTFKRTYVQYAFCAPSRNSFMSGRRPDTTQVWNFMDHFREEGVGTKIHDFQNIQQLTKTLKLRGDRHPVRCAHTPPPCHL